MRRVCFMRVAVSSTTVAAATTNWLIRQADIDINCLASDSLDYKVMRDSGQARKLDRTQIKCHRNACLLNLCHWLDTSLLFYFIIKIVLWFSLTSQFFVWRLLWFIVLIRASDSELINSGSHLAKKGALNEYFVLHVSLIWEVWAITELIHNQLMSRYIAHLKICAGANRKKNVYLISTLCDFRVCQFT